ncbi:MAG: hypothetical protein H0U74_05310 [Bradymonadaceae bacterium]|nr:hypothetical protein [Lujinxingiaceae bacterium]
MFKRLATALVVAGSLVMAGPAAAADDDMNFGAEEGEVGHLSELLKQGKLLYEQKNYAEASLIFHNILSDEAFGAEAYFPEAEYELAKTLFRMELYQGALAYFGRIVDQGDFHPYYVPALRGLLLLTDVIPGDALLNERLATYVERYPADVPDQYRDRYAYLVGRYFYNTMDVDQALRMLNMVTSRSDLYPSARYISAITHVANYDAKPAVDAFRDVLRFLSQRNEATGKLNADERTLLDLTNLGMARVFYSTGQFDTSLRYYSRLTRTSPLWLQSLFESSWAFFQVDQYNHALGNLHTLNAPFFSDAYFPEGPVLSAVIFFYNCKYGRVRNVLEDYEYTYDGLRKEIASVMQNNDDPMEMFKWVQKLRADKSDYDAQLFRILDAALGDEQVKQKFDLVDSIARESKKMESMAATWKSSKLGDLLIQESGLANSFAVSDAGELTQQRLQRVVRELEDLIMQQKRILFEVARAERGEIEADIRAGMLLDGQATDKAQLKVSDEQLYWTFDGEYWRDELGFYVFSINSECRR